MAFPTNEQSPVRAAELIVARAKALRRDTTTLIQQCDGGTLNVHDVAAGFMANHLARVKTELVELVQIAGIYNQLVALKPTRFPDAATAQADVAAMQSAINSLIVFLEANLPMDAQRRVLSLIVSNDGSGTLAQRTITGAGVTTFRAELVTFQQAFEA